MCILPYIYGSYSLELGGDLELFCVVQDFCLVTVFISLVGGCISFLFHSHPRNHFIVCQILFHFYFIPTQEIISLVARFISFLFHSLFHWLPDLFHFYFFLTQLFISSLFHFYFILCFIGCQNYFISISFLPSCLFHPYFISVSFLPS